MAHYFLRSHGKYYDENGFITQDDLNTQFPDKNIEVRFYGPSGFAMGGGLADWLTFGRGNFTHVRFTRRHNYDRRGSHITDAQRRMQFPVGHVFENFGSGNNERYIPIIRNYTMESHAGLLDGEVAGIYFLSNQQYDTGDWRPGILDSYEGDVTLRCLLIHLTAHAGQNGDQNVFVHWAQCRSYDRGRPPGSSNYKWNKA